MPHTLTTRDAAGIIGIGFILAIGLWLGAEAAHAWAYAVQHPALWQPDTL